MHVNINDFISTLNRFEESVQRKDIQDSDILKLAAPILQGMGKEEQQDVLIRAIYEAGQSVATEQKIKTVMKYVSGERKKRVDNIHQHLAPCTVILDNGEVKVQQELLKKHSKTYRIMKEDTGFEQVEPDQVDFENIKLEQFEKLVRWMEKREIELTLENWEEWFKIANYLEIGELLEEVLDFAENIIEINLDDPDGRTEYHRLAKFAREFKAGPIQRRLDQIATKWFFCYFEDFGKPQDNTSKIYGIWREIRDECDALALRHHWWKANDYQVILKDGKRLMTLAIKWSPGGSYVSNVGSCMFNDCKKFQELNIETLRADDETLKIFSELKELRSLVTPRNYLKIYYSKMGSTHFLQLLNLRSLRCNSPGDESLDLKMFFPMNHYSH